jgi:hypothetical protein
MGTGFACAAMIRLSASSLVAARNAGVVGRRKVNPLTVCDGRSERWSRDRLVAQCFADDRDIAQDIVESGNACDWRKYSGGHYSRNGVGQACPDGHRERRKLR